MTELFPDSLEAALRVALSQVGITAENEEEVLLTVIGPHGIRVITKTHDKNYTVDTVLEPIEEV